MGKESQLRGRECGGLAQSNLVIVIAIAMNMDMDVEMDMDMNTSKRVTSVHEKPMPKAEMHATSEKNYKA